MPYCSADQGKNTFAQNVPMTDINGKHHSFDCKHKHMMKEGAPPDNFGILHCLLSKEFIDFNTKNDLDGYHPLVPGLSHF